MMATRARMKFALAGSPDYVNRLLRQRACAIGVAFYQFHLSQIEASQLLG